VAARIVRIPERHADRVLAGLAVLAVACGVIVGIGEERLTLGGSGSSTAPLVIRVSGTTPLRFGPNRVALDVMRSRLQATPGVTGVGVRPVAAGGRRTSIIVRLADDPKSSEAAVSTIESELDPGPLRIVFSGGASELRDAREQTIHDLRLLLLAVPLAALILIAALGARAALATLFAGAAAVFGAGALCVGLSLFVDISVLCLVGAAAAGIPSAVLLCGLERRAAEPRAVIAAALASALAFGALAALGVGYLAAAGLGGALASLLAAPAAVVAIRAATSLWHLEPRVERTLGGLVATLGWNRVVAIAIAILSIGTLVVIGLPATRLDSGALAATGPPSISTERALTVAGSVLACLTAIGWIAGGRPLAALITAACVPLAPAAAVGLAVIVFQDGHLQRLLDFDSFTIGVGPLAIGAVTVAAASAAQGIATVSSAQDPEFEVKPSDPARRDVLASVRAQSAVYASTVTAAAAASTVAALAAACLLASSLEFAKAFGFIVAAGLLLDLVFVRGLLGAAMAALASRRRERPPAAG
jgi:hypothetical protein